MRKNGLLICTLLLMSLSSLQAQSNLQKVKNVFGAKKEPSKLDQQIQYLNTPSLKDRFSGNAAEKKTATYLGEEFRKLLFKPYLGQYVHRFSIDKKNNLSDDSYVKIYNEELAVGADLIIPPFSGAGSASAQALPGMEESENLWFIKFSEVGTNLNNKFSTGYDKMYRKAKEAIEAGASAVMYINDAGASSDFTNSFAEKKEGLSKPVFILNHAAYKKYILTKKAGKDWIDVDYSFATERRKAEGHNAAGIWQNKSNQYVLIIARMDKSANQGNNTSGLAALLAVADRLNKQRLTKYNYVVAALSGTEDKNIGAESFIKKLRLSKNNVNCVINLGDVAALNSKNMLYASGTGTSTDWEKVLGGLSRNFVLNNINSPEVSAENHRAFYKMGIPVLNIFTKNPNNNRGINKAGVAKIANSMSTVLAEIDKLPKFTFQKTEPLPDLSALNFKVDMGIAPDYAFAGKGLLIGHVLDNGVAAYSDVRDGDVLVRMGEYDINSPADFVREMSKYIPGQRVMIKVKRAGQDKQMLLRFK